MSLMPERSHIATPPLVRQRAVAESLVRLRIALPPLAWLRAAATRITSVLHLHRAIMTGHERRGVVRRREPAML